MMSQVYKGAQGAGVQVKQEPMESDGLAQNQTNRDVNKDDMREVLLQILNSHKELSVVTVIEDLVRRNVLLTQSDAKKVKPTSREPLSKLKEAGTKDLGGNVLQPKDPTSTCTTEDVVFSNINEALVETNVNGKSNPEFDADLVCAVGSKVNVMTPEGQTLQIDLTYFWCNFCNFKSEKKDVILKHMLDHRFHCKYCKFQSFSRAAVIHHSVQQHEEFGDVAQTLKYCTYLPDILQRSVLTQNKRKRKDEENEDLVDDNSNDEESEEESIDDEDDDEDQPSPKKVRLDEELSMEVDEVGESGEVCTSLTNKIIVPTTAKNQTPPSPEKKSMEKETEAATTLLSTNTPNTVDITLPVSQTSDSLQPEAMSSESPSPVSSLSSSSNVNSSHTTSTQTTDDNLPLIISVHSGTEAVEKAKKPGMNAQKQSIKQSSGKETWLCWNCGYCPFVTLSQAVLKIHLNGDHQGKPHKYVAMLVSSKQMLDRIRQSDLKLGSLHHNREGFTSTSETQTSLIEKPQDKEASPICWERIPPQEKADIEENVDEKEIPVSYKCAHCNLSGPDPNKLTKHLKAKHMGCVMYVLDMKAVKLRQKRYLFFCLMKGCVFMTKEMDEFLKHEETCRPKWRVDTVSSTLKSINLTKQFISKTSSQSQTTDSKSNKAAEYGCLYCCFQCSNNTRIKKHVLFNHQSRPTAINNLSPLKSEDRKVINFCQVCLWEARGETELSDHLSKEHNETSKQGVNNASKQTNSNIEHQPAGSLTSNVDINADIIQGNSESPVVSLNNNSNASIDSASSTEIPSSLAGDISQHHFDMFEDNPFIVTIMGKDEYEKALAMYVTSEGLGNKGGRRRPQRNAAVKSKKRNKKTKLPALYKCFYCENFMAFGSRLIKDHISCAHKGLCFQAYDRLKLEGGKEQATVYICPFENNSDNCVFTSPCVDHVLNHGIKKHEMQPSLAYLSGNSSSSSIHSTIDQRPATTTTGESYKCLYCLHNSLIYHARQDIKKHLIESHPEEDFVMRDCIARNLALQSRVYMCHMLTCDFTCQKKNDYKLHLLAHSKSKIYQCTKCDWINLDMSSANTHIAEEHGRNQATTVEIDLDLDSSGVLIQLIRGTVIKVEKE